jgi:hypothetical protein
MPNENDKTLHDILETVTFLKDNAVTQTKFREMREQVDKIEQRLERVEDTMITKAYLDTKLEELRGDHVALSRKADAKLRTLVDLLRTRQVVSNEDANRILAMEPFPLPTLSR